MTRINREVSHFFYFSICRLPHKSTLQKNPANHRHHRRLAAALSHQASFAMVSPKNPASAAAANPANATRRPVRSQLRLPAHPFQPTLLTNQKRELVEREGMVQCRKTLNPPQVQVQVQVQRATFWDLGANPPQVQAQLQVDRSWDLVPNPSQMQVQLADIWAVVSKLENIPVSIYLRRDFQDWMKRSPR
uniref:Uncharacterized protein n=2 Tax=Globisporangium ultimum (strain ATCC 200006 / CBS 805.95 / DAOM BR144) TaxID=431595 RepID=K3XD40_GLOUD